MVIEEVGIVNDGAAVSITLSTVILGLERSFHEEMIRFYVAREPRTFRWNKGQMSWISTWMMV